jgi:hypothetical protein
MIPQRRTASHCLTLVAILAMTSPTASTAQSLAARVDSIFAFASGARGSSMRLNPAFEDFFRSGNLFARFVRDEKGEVIAMDVSSGERVRNLRFERQRRVDGIERPKSSR